MPTPFASSASAPTPPPPIRVIFFDGVCHVCNASVCFVLRHEQGPFFQFAPLQSAAAERLLAPLGVSPRSHDSMIVLIDGRVLFASDAALAIVARLRRPWRWLRFLRCVPRAARDALYRSFARQRYRLFGKNDTCALAPPAWRERFLED